MEDGGNRRPIIVDCEARVRLGDYSASAAARRWGTLGIKKAFHGREIVDTGWARSLLRLLLEGKWLRGGLFATGRLSVTRIAKNPTDT